jgi:hypothetical protein
MEPITASFPFRSDGGRSLSMSSSVKSAAIFFKSSSLLIVL